MLRDKELRLYHREVFWCEWFDDGVKRLIAEVNVLHPHLEQRLTETDRNHDYDIQGLYRAFLTVKNDPNPKAFEVGTDLSGNVLKAVIRTKYDDTRDISIVFRKDGDEYYIKTAWLNNSTDAHFTLDENKYRKG